MKNKSFYILLISLFFLSACSEWTTATDDGNACKPGKSVEAVYEDLIIKSENSSEITVWASYNGEGCGDKAGAASDGQPVEWAQIVENASGELFVNITAQDMTGWVNCSDVTFTGDMEHYLDLLHEDGFDLYLECVNISNR